MLYVLTTVYFGFDHRQILSKWCLLPTTPGHLLSSTMPMEVFDGGHSLNKGEHTMLWLDTMLQTTFTITT